MYDVNKYVPLKGKKNYQGNVSSLHTITLHGSFQLYKEYPQSIPEMGKDSKTKAKSPKNGIRFEILGYAQEGTSVTIKVGELGPEEETSAHKETSPRKVQYF